MSDTNQIKRTISRHLNNWRGWRTDRKLVVIESDDWGSICMPSKRVFESLIAKDIRVDLCPYATYDSIANEEDMSALFKVLSGVSDSKGRPAVITANTIMTNPDFEKIEESDFSEYHYELFTDSLKKYSGNNTFDYYKDGTEAGIFFPQFHGREHLNVKEWMRQLSNPGSVYRNAFKEGVCWLGSKYDPRDGVNLRATYDTNNGSDILWQQAELKEGLDLFRNCFEKKSESFIAPNYILHSDLQHVLQENGVKYMQGMKYLVLPKLGEKKHELKRRIQGNRDDSSLINLIRNCEFEPSQYPPSYDSVGECLKGIKNAFFWDKPAIISAHRINFIGRIRQENRTRNLKLFRELLKRITEYWPDVEFMTSVELGETIEKP